MAKRTQADQWHESGQRDETGTFIDLDFTCPYCGESNSKYIFVGESGLSCIDSGFEVDESCTMCGRDVIVECE